MKISAYRGVMWFQVVEREVSEWLKLFVLFYLEWLILPSKVSVNILFISGIGIISSKTGYFTSTVVAGVTPSVVISYVS